MSCANHPSIEARWQCTQCGALWCGDCPRAVGLTAHRVCPTCGSAIAAYAPLRSVDQMLARSARRVFSTEGLLTAAGLGLFYGTLSWLWAIPIIYLGTLVSYYFVTVHHVGANGEGLPSSGESIQRWSELVSLALGGILCASLGLAPLVAFAYHAPVALDARTILALLLVGQLYMPAIVLAIAVTNSAWSAIWPLAWIRVVARAPGPYVRFVGMWVVSVAIALGIALMTAELGDRSWITDSIVASVWTLFWIFQASLVGEYIRSNAEAFGWD
ncbi:MAG: hypothetical protein AB7T06_26785 [Kofleriaceae bacterium]